MIEFDSSKTAIFSPQNLNFTIPVRKAVLVFDDDTWDDHILPNTQLKAMEVKNNRGRVFNSYRLIYRNNEPILLVYPPTGGSASVMEVELLIASGINKIVSFGTCGSMDIKIAKNTLIIPTAARREEGTSYHYLPDSNEVEQATKSIEALKSAISEAGEEYIEGKIWTIDAIYRETRDKLEKLQKLGYVCVDMELASLLALAQFRGIDFAQFVISDDNIAGVAEKPEKAKNLEKLLEIAFLALGKL